MASQTIEELARSAPGAKWIQMYMWRDRGLTRELIQRAADTGAYSALVLTVDTPRVGPRERDVRNRFTPPPNWLREQWAGPLVLKGILTAADAATAAEVGVDGISVSNHGGRQLDHAPAAVDALPRVVDAAGDRVEVYMDGGIRRGTDLVKALALGARACLIARPLLYGLGIAGRAGVSRALGILRAELELTLALVGASTLDELGRDHLNEIDLVGTVDIAIVATKAYDTLWMARLAEPHLASDGTALSAQNGMNEDALVEVFGAARTIDCVVPYGAEKVSAGVVRRTLSEE